MGAQADRADPMLTSYVEWPGICGHWPLFGGLVHRFLSGHRFNRARYVDDTGHLVAQDGAAGIHYKEVR